jgi:hypothetical protein
VEFNVFEHNGSNGLANITANGNVFAVRAQVGGSLVTRWLLDEDGDTWQAGGATMGGTLAVTGTTVLTGNVGIGHSGDTRALVVQETDAQNIAAFLVAHASGYGIVVDYYANTPNDTSHDAFTFEDSTAIRFTVKSNGGIYNYQSNDVDLSDERMKIIHNPTASKWDAHAALEVFDYHYTESPDTRLLIGVGAHQAGECDERLCGTDEWEVGDEKYHAVYTKDLSFYTMKTVQECQARIEALEAALAAM